MTNIEEDIDELLSDDELIELEPTIQNLIDEKSLQWIFVGGKGGVGKTTISSSIAVQLSKVRESVLIISTDPAHNLSDAFDQKFGEKPTQVKGIDNLFAMEIDPKVESDKLLKDFIPGESGSSFKSMFKDIGTSLPGMDEFTTFLEIMRQVKKMEYSCVVFDTAPTGHTLRLLSFPSLLEKGVGKVMNIQNIGSIMNQVSSMFSNVPSPDSIKDQMGETKGLIEEVSKQFKDPTKTTFVCVCIPEFLSVYETERLVQELTKSSIDSHNVVVNQLVLQPKDCQCTMCLSRMKIQQKYLKQIYELYEDFHILQMPLLGEEVRGVEPLKQFSKYLLEPHSLCYDRNQL